MPKVICHIQTQLPLPLTGTLYKDSKNEYYILSILYNHRAICISLQDGIPWSESKFSIKQAIEGLTYVTNNYRIDLHNIKIEDDTHSRRRDYMTTEKFTIKKIPKKYQFQVGDLVHTNDPMFPGNGTVIEVWYPKKIEDIIIQDHLLTRPFPLIHIVCEKGGYITFDADDLIEGQLTRRNK